MELPHYHGTVTLSNIHKIQIAILFFILLVTDMQNVAKKSPASKIFRKKFSQRELSKGFYKKVRRKSTKGVDRVSPSIFQKELDNNIKTISKKCLKGTYKFSPYLEFLKLKGRGKAPRVICIPTVRDRVVLQQLKETLFEVFPECVRRKTSRNFIQEINSYIQSNKESELSIIYGDIKSFYDSIDRSILFEKINRKIKSKTVLTLLRRAVESPVMPKGYKRLDLKHYKLKEKGIPQGLAISNVLASIYLHDFDEIMKSEEGKYFRYIDDILIICSKESRKAITSNVKEAIEGDRFKLKLHEQDKVFSGSRDVGFRYLGYYFKPNGLVSVSESNIEKYIEGIASKFAAYSNRKRYTMDKDKILTKEERQSILVKEINFKITGTIAQDRRYGWVFYYSEINDLSVLHRIDKCIERFFKRSHDFPGGTPRNLKKLSRAFYESKYSPHSGYIHDYRRYKTVQRKHDYLISKGQIGKDKKYTPKQIEAMFINCMHREISELEKDERNIYPLA